MTFLPGLRTVLVGVIGMDDYYETESGSKLRGCRNVVRKMKVKRGRNGNLVQPMPKAPISNLTLADPVWLEIPSIGQNLP